MDGRISLTRTELYMKVWSTPMRTLSKEFGMSDVGLAKLCRRHQIPVPGLGYWAKVQFGQKPERLPLPAADARFENITIYRTERSERAVLDRVEKAQVPHIEVAEDRPIAHIVAR